MRPSQLAIQLGSGLLSFPVTHFDAGLGFDEPKYREHVSWLLDHKPAGLFAAGGTGEFFSLSLDEVEAVVASAVAEAAGRAPVVAGCGYGTSLAIDLACRAERAGADGILLLPPYLLFSEAEGLEAHIEAVCGATGLGVIVYNRDNAILNETSIERLCAKCPNLVGYKDGVGDIELMTRVYAAMGDRLVYIGGLPTAETFAMPYLQMGVSTYSSAIFNFMPEFAARFYAAVRRQDHAFVLGELRSFVLPYIALRNRRRGYAVSIVKAGMKAVGRPAGSVRAPLVDLNATDYQALEALISAHAGRVKPVPAPQYQPAG